ncbi:ABC transporter ATP-binding protein [Pelagibacterium sp. 26DY04]|uniref:ABC transporter ATP-binding protein n=1 Tax=Pelagibacterium sp. 26DY04 TaxID=2967130 RepID=UPI0028158AAB|nr:ABC transporter ATP-binding protein [Pelagibacterium sp. 26DY04]WMT87144.1 ABC transporter ATP-binding protein [Pelagibacterium sp. 26DY04]
MIELENVSARFKDAAGTVIDAVKDVSLTLAPGAVHAIIGPSGSGKTTLLHIIAGILVPTAGTVQAQGITVSKLGESARDAWRRKNCGMIFQDFRLIDELGPLGNVLVPSWFGRNGGTDIRRSARDLLAHFDVPARSGPVAMLSRGQQQRVAMARALVLSPQIILADEPTASVDKVNAERIIDELARLAGEGRTVIVVSHDERVAARADHVIEILNGTLNTANGAQTEHAQARGVH